MSRAALWCLLAALVAVAALPVAAAASGGGSGGGGGSEEPAAAEGGVDEAAEAALAIATAEPGIAAVIAGAGATVTGATPWGGGQDGPVGYRLGLSWPEAGAREVNEVWPLQHSRGQMPQPPYDSADYRIRARDVTALQVDVLLTGGQVIQVMPVDGETHFVLEEQTWSPFSWMPWFTSHPWTPAPVLVAIAVVLMVRAWLRSRAWNRRLPSMTRHDRQFIARLAILLFLVVGFAWQFYEGWYAATGPSVDPRATSADSLASLPLLLIPPGLFVAALILELGAGQHRGSWALLAVLSGSACAFYLASAMTGVTTNLNLTYFVLLGVLCLISIPRAFSAGKMGWSRGASPHYG